MLVIPTWYRTKSCLYIFGLIRCKSKWKKKYNNEEIIADVLFKTWLFSWHSLKHPHFFYDHLSKPKKSHVPCMEKLQTSASVVNYSKNVSFLCFKLHELVTTTEYSLLYVSIATSYLVEKLTSNCTHNTDCNLFQLFKMNEARNHNEMFIYTYTLY